MAASALGEMSNDDTVRWGKPNHKPLNSDTLIKALENFVVPLIHGYSQETNQVASTVEPHLVDEDGATSPSLTAEAQSLLIALKEFVVSLTRPTSYHQEKVNSGEEPQNGMDATPPEPDEAHESWGQNSYDMILDVMPVVNDFEEIVEDSRLLKLVLEKAQDVVFNVIPIRLLMFDAAGENIRLVERPEIWRRISPQIEREFDEHRMTIDIIARTSKIGKSQTTSEAEVAAIDQYVRTHVKYAVLSHTWLQSRPGEVTYGNWSSKSFTKYSAGYSKLANFCRVAATTYNVTLGWMDTICINKDSSSELDESIRSMFKWYEFSEVCIAYLGDTVSLESMHTDTWFTRGWTLQELIAPPYLKFYTSDWARVVAPTRSPTSPKNDKRNDLVLRKIRKATTITEKELGQSLQKIPISRRMQWAADRRVTREEDTAYSLMGIFEVSISTAYGEGAERAFVRLVKEILNTDTPDVVDIVNWGYGPVFPLPRSGTAHTSVLIPLGPKPYTWRTQVDIRWQRPTAPILLTQLGLRVPVLMMPAIMANSALPSSSKCEPYGCYSGTAIDIDSLSRHRNVRCTFNILDRRIFDMSASKTRNHITVKTFGVLNITDTKAAVKVSEDGLCFSVILDVEPSPVQGIIADELTRVKRLPTMQAIAFKLKRHGTRSFTIPKNELQRHGMSLHSIYL